MAATGEKLLDQDYPDQIAPRARFLSNVSASISQQAAIAQHRANFAALLQPFVDASASLLRSGSTGTLLRFLSPLGKSIDVPLVTLLDNVTALYRGSSGTSYLVRPEMLRQPCKRSQTSRNMLSSATEQPYQFILQIDELLGNGSARQARVPAKHGQTGRLSDLSRNVFREAVPHG